MISRLGIQAALTASVMIIRLLMLGGTLVIVRRRRLVLK